MVLAPHTDDGELGCGGTIAKFVKEGKEVHYIAFSFADQQRLKDELYTALDVLGVISRYIYIHSFKRREFKNQRQELLDLMINYDQDINPEAVLIPSSFDMHQDHYVIHREGIRAFKRRTILGYEQPWNNITFRTDFFIPLNKEYIDLKIKALACYKSQKHRKYLDPDFIEALAKVRGIQANVDYAEAFETIRVIYNNKNGEVI